MKTRSLLLLIAAALSGILDVAPRALGATAQPMLVQNLTGGLRIQQSLPGTCDNVDQTTPVSQGRIEMAPALGIDVAGGKRFVLTRANVFFAPFTIERHCMTQDAVREYTEIGVYLAQAVGFTATPAGSGIYQVTIPKEDFLINQAAIVNGDPESGPRTPQEDVTATIDFANGTVEMRVVVGMKIHFEWGCTPLGCLVNEDRTGTLTATLAGDIVLPDTDGDSVPDGTDNCTFVPNPTQAPVATPSIVAPPAVVIASCLDRVFGGASAFDRCEGGPVTVTNNAPATFLVGPNVVTWTAQDAQARTSSANQTVTVVDTTRPVFTLVPSDIGVNDCGPVDLGLPTATDDCAGTPAFTNDAPASFGLGATVVTWTASDASGNQSTATQTVTVVDTVAPTVSCVASGPPGGAFQVIATDACTSHPIVRLGSYALTSGETIKIEEIGRPGVVELVQPVGADGIRHFLVGRGEAVISATDGSGNTATAICR